MRIAIPKETAPGETRVAAVPETVKRLKAAGTTLAVQAGAGEAAFFPDDAYRTAGAEIVADAAELLAAADLVLKVRAPADGEIPLLRRGCVLVSVLAPAASAALLQQLAAAGVSAISLDLLPRITRAQVMDVLSSMGTIAGYKAALIAVNELGKLAPMMITAAGTIRPATALVVGAGVAGLQAIATAKRIGAVVTGIDVRPAAAEQVRSLGAKFVPMEVQHAAETAGGYAADLGEAYYAREQAILAPHVKTADVVITTALVPNRRAPLLITAEMVEAMKGGSVIVDLAAAAGGNCSLTRPDERVVYAGVTVLGPTNLPAAVPAHASLMFARNVAAFVAEIAPGAQIALNMENEIVRATLVTHEGKVLFG